VRARLLAEDTPTLGVTGSLINGEPIDKTAVARDMPAWRERKRFVKQVETDLAHKGGYEGRKQCFMVAERL
jgi:hypothetical protein